MAGFPNSQSNPQGASPVILVNTTYDFYTAAGSSGGAAAPYQATPLGYEQITNLSAAVGFASVPTGATFAYVEVEGANVRWRDDGTNPTASVGMPVYAGSAPTLFSGDLAALKFIQVVATATLNVSFYK